MRGKLSHPFDGPSRPGSPQAEGEAGSSPGIAFALAIAIGLLALTGCERLDTDSATPANDSDRSSGSYAADGETSFRWPMDPHHPLIRIEIEGPRGDGAIEIELLPELAPKTVPHVLRLVDDGFYDGTTFHRVIPGFMIQGGDPNSLDRDPTNDGRGGTTQTVGDEFGPAPFERGVVAMANKGRANSGGSQFFIMQAANRALDEQYTVIGRVRSGMDVVDEITRVDIDTVGRWGPADRPIENVVMTRVRSVEVPDVVADRSSPQGDALGEARGASESVASTTGEG